jgi:5-methylcytosine-specific restriction endonuclease McrA
MSGFDLWKLNDATYKKFMKEKTMTRHEAKKLIDLAFPKVEYHENRFVMVKGDASPFNGNMVYWSARNAKLYDGKTAKALKKQNHSCGICGLKFFDEERIHLHHVDGNHGNWKSKNLLAIHESCHDYLHMSKQS